MNDRELHHHTSLIQFSQAEGSFEVQAKIRELMVFGVTLKTVGRQGI